jgi:hypothetical protein
MSGIDFAVWLALLLSLGSAILCVAYGLVRWNEDGDAADASSSGGDSQESPPVTPAGRDGR